jgi:DNA-directed RNA polymerase subunit alpha
LNSLRRGGITTVSELVTKTEKELLALRNFGEKSRKEVEDRLSAMGLALAIGDEGTSINEEPAEAGEAEDIEE